MEEFEVSPTAPSLLCASLSQRKTWAPVAAQLLQSGTQWREANLGTHDIALTVPREPPGMGQVFRFLLLTPAEVGAPERDRRIKNLYLLNGGSNAAIIFLADEDSTRGATQFFMELQIEMMEGTISGLRIILLTSPTDFLMTLRTFLTSLVNSALSRPWPLDMELLGKVIRQEGRDRISSIVQRDETARFLSFWAYDFALE